MTREEILNAIADDKTLPFIQPSQLAGIVDFVIKNYVPSIPGVGEAAENYAHSLGYDKNEDKAEIAAAKEDFIAGVEWRDAQIPKLPNNVDEAAFSYENDLWESGFKECGYSPQEVSDAFKAGVEWLAGQGISMPGKVGIYGIDVEKITEELRDAGFRLGEEVILQIRKKQ